MNERSIFLAALEIEDPQRRAAYLRDACGADADLRRGVDELLQADAAAGSFMGTPAGTIGGSAADTNPDSPISLDFLAASDQPGSLGRLGSYEITRVIGLGGMGIVLEARDTRLDRIVAVKVLAPQLAATPAARQRFLREAKAAAAVRDEHVVTIYAVEEAKGLPYLVMELVAGLSLQERIDRGGPLALKEILRIGMQTARGLAAAHAHGLIHRDVKPANILLENGVERVKLTDFGLARVADDASLTQSGVIAGTPQYMAPEQAKGEPVDHRADLFSLGSVLYAMCTGRPPFRAESTVATLRRVCDETPPPIREVEPEIPEWLVAIIDRLLAKKREERLQTAAEVAEALGQHLAELHNAWRAGGADRRADHRFAAVPGVSPLRTAPPQGTHVPRSALSRWTLVLAAPLAALVALSLTELAGLTQAVPAVIRLVRGEGTPTVERSADEATVAVENRGAFVVRNDKGALVGAIDTLAGAVANSSPGDTIEVHGDGPFFTDPLLVNHALTVRAAAGFRPVIRLDPDRDKTAFLLLRAHAPLVLEGLEFQRLAPNLEGQWQAIIQSAENLSLVNCRLLATSHRDCVWCARSLTAWNSEFLVSEPNNMTPVSWHPGNHRSAVIDNCVIMGAIFSQYKGEPLGSPASVIQLRNNTFVAIDGLRIDVAQPPPAGPADATGAPIDVVAARNVFALRRSMLSFKQSASAAPFDTPAAESLLRRFMSWRQEQNLHASGSSLCTFRKGDGAVAAGQDLGEWDRFWGFSGTGTIQGTIRFQGGDLFARAQTEVARLTLEDFRLHEGSAGYRAGPGSKDLGADIDLVGPGAAYERWKKMPAYEEWLKETGQTK